MADETRYTSSDVPDFSTYPATPLLPREGSEPNYAYGRYNPELEERARKIGRALGHLVNKLEEVRSRAQHRFDYDDDAQGAIDNAKEKAQQTFSDVRRKAVRLQRRAVNDFPVQMILAAGVFGIVTGVGLRVWRENRD